MTTEDKYVFTLPCMVFVYGTLKQGKGNHGLLRNAEFVGEDTTEPGHVMTGRGIPFVRLADETDPDEVVGQVAGEVYLVDGAHTMWVLDRLEGHPRCYTRTLVKTSSGRECWIYYYNHKARYQGFDYVSPDAEGTIRYA